MSIWADMKRKANLKLAHEKLARPIHVFELSRKAADESWFAKELGEMPYRKYLVLVRGRATLLDFDAMFTDVESEYFRKWLEVNRARSLP